MHRKSFIFLILLAILTSFSSCKQDKVFSTEDKDNIDCINPYVGNISLLLEPTQASLYLPNSMLRVHPMRQDYSSETIAGLPICLTSHRGQNAFRLSPINNIDKTQTPIKEYIYDHEVVKPYYYSVYLPEEKIAVEYAPMEHSAIYELDFQEEGSHALVLTTLKGKLTTKENTIFGYQDLGQDTKIYLYLEHQQEALSKATISQPNKIVYSAKDSLEGESIMILFNYTKEKIKLRYGISFISVEQAKQNMLREVQTYELNLVSKYGKSVWEEAINKINIEGATADERATFYTALYRCYERMTNISEEGQYFSPADKTIHQDEGTPFYTDDWIWDSYLALHPLRTLLNPKQEEDMLSSYLRMAEQSEDGWLPTFPEITGDSHRMNGNHSIIAFLDAYNKGLTHLDLNKVYHYAQKTLKERSYLPWTKSLKGDLSKFFDENNYFPALNHKEQESDELVTKWEKRQAVAVTLASAYDYWAVNQLALKMNDSEYAEVTKEKALAYRNLFNTETGFFHPKNKDGKFIYPFDYELSGGLGARDYYDENNAYTYRWDLKYNIPELIELMGGKEKFTKYLDESLRTKLSKSKWQFYSQMPDQTGNIGQLAFGNEPCLHIPYLYNYAGQSWRTQRLLKKLIPMYFRNDLMGVSGDEDGGGLSAFVVFTMMGFYPTCPGKAYYNIGVPFFPCTTIQLSNKRKFTIVAEDLSEENIYIQSATLNGKDFNRSYIKHNEILDGGTLTFKMGNRPNLSWGQEAYPK